MGKFKDSKAPTSEDLEKPFKKFDEDIDAEGMDEGLDWLEEE